MFKALGHKNRLWRLIGKSSLFQLRQALLRRSCPQTAPFLTNIRSPCLQSAQNADNTMVELRRLLRSQQEHFISPLLMLMSAATTFRSGKISRPKAKTRNCHGWQTEVVPPSPAVTKSLTSRGPPCVGQDGAPVPRQLHRRLQHVQERLLQQGALQLGLQHRLREDGRAAT